MDNLLSFLIAASIIVTFLLLHLRKTKKREEEARTALEKGKLRSDGPQSQHPHIDTTLSLIHI